MVEGRALAWIRKRVCLRQVLDASARYLSLTARLLSTATFTGACPSSVGPSALPYGWAAADATAPLLLRFLDSPPRVAYAVPSIASSAGGQTVRVRLAALQTANLTGAAAVFCAPGPAGTCFSAASVATFAVGDGLGDVYAAVAIPAAPTQASGVALLSVLLPAARTSLIAPFAFTSAVVAAACVGGCSAAVDARSAWARATVRLRAPVPTTLPAFLEAAAARCSIPVVPENASVYRCEAAVDDGGSGTAPAAAAPCADGRRSYCLDVAVVYRARLVDDPAGRSAPLSTAEKLSRFAANNRGLLYLAYTDASGGTTTVAVAVAFVRAPQLLRAALSPDGSRMSFDFDQDVLGEPLFDCSAAIAPAAALGVGAGCRWASASLVVSLGRGAAVTAGDAVAVITRVRSAGNVSLASSPVLAVVEPPWRLAVPSLAVDGPSSVGPCETAVFVAQSVFPRCVKTACSFGF